MKNKKDINAKRKFKIDFEIIRGYVNEFDPCGFIANDAPLDEYDDITMMILNSINNKNTISEIKLDIINILENCYDSGDLKNLNEPYNTNFNNSLNRLLYQIIDFQNKS